MSNSPLVKGQCQQCGGHLEFSDDDAGQTISCPHCDQPTGLVIPALPHKTSGSGRLWLGLGVVVCLVAMGLAGVILHSKHANQGSDPASPTLPVAQSNTPTTAVPPKALNIVTNDFTILPFKLEKTSNANSSLVYVVGIVKNMSDNQRFGVKVEFGLFDTNDNAIGLATDYQSVLEPHGEWRFKALVVASKAVSAKFNSIGEDK